MEVNKTNRRALVYECYINGKSVEETAVITQLEHHYITKTFNMFIIADIPVPNRIKQAKAIEAELFSAIEKKLNKNAIDILQKVYSKFLAI